MKSIILKTFHSKKSIMQQSSLQNENDVMTHNNKKRIRTLTNAETYNFETLGGFERPESNPENVK
jgi:hypothetical protein